jgi:hypothetical protein
MFEMIDTWNALVVEARAIGVPHYFVDHLAHCVAIVEASAGAGVVELYEAVTAAVRAQRFVVANLPA